MSLARSFLSDPHGMIFIHASCDQTLMNSPITKLSFVILSVTKNLFFSSFTSLKMTSHTEVIFKITVLFTIKRYYEGSQYIEISHIRSI